MKKTATGIILATSLLGGGTIVADNAQNPYVDNGTQYTLAVASDVPQKERLEIAKDKPEITLKKWNDKLSVKIKPQFHATEKGSVKKANRPLLSKKMEFKKGNQTAFVAPKEDDPTAFDIDFTLAQKPASNVFLYQIEGAEELDFFYQPELTAEEKAQGAHRPDNVVGSYAVYHKTLKNHIEGQTNYATGKAFHIYRPKATDAKGKEVWAELSYASGTLAVTVPQDFLNGAKYPVVVDPTFGYTSVGATGYATIAAEGSGTYNLSLMAGRNFTLSEAGTLSSISAALAVQNTPDTGTVFFAIYIEDSAGAGSHDLVASVENTSQTVTSTAAFYTNNVSASLSADDYILAALGDGNTWHNGSFQFLQLKSDTGASGNIYEEQTTGAGSYTTRKGENPWTETAASSNTIYSIYATYTADGGGSTAPDDGLILFD